MSYSKDKLKEFALEYVNEVRSIFGKKPIKQLKKGKRENGSCCTLTNSLGLDTNKVYTEGDGEVYIYNMAMTSNKEKYVKKLKTVDVDFGDANSSTIKIIPKKHPKAIEQFIEKFDAGSYPELIAKEV